MSTEHGGHEWHRQHDSKMSLLRHEQIKLIFAIDGLVQLLTRQTLQTSGRTAPSPPPTSPTSTVTTVPLPTMGPAPRAWTSRAQWLLGALRKAAPKVAVWVLEKVWTYLWPLLWGVAVAAFTWAQLLINWLKGWWMLLVG